MDTTQFPILGHKESLRHTLNVVCLGGASANIWPVDVSNVEFVDISQCFLLGIHPVDAYENHTLAFVLAPGLFEISSLFTTRRTPGCPKVDNDHLSPQLTQSNGLAAKICDGEVGGHTTFDG